MYSKFKKMCKYNHMSNSCVLFGGSAVSDAVSKTEEM